MHINITQIIEPMINSRKIMNHYINWNRGILCIKQNKKHRLQGIIHGLKIITAVGQPTKNTSLDSYSAINLFTKGFAVTAILMYFLSSSITRRGHIVKIQFM